ncbi:hypothetical protein AMTR_s00092p00142510 [Amborella trichopoda]|uniref:Uncharacterized protein n=1 Tax=Amborella trichopoda TaxID=13333 RepID=W1NVB2_AMBTC|nr:hypothetical protein AMTR_s00092p00142510 [Amborella trichopoda]
MLASSFDKPYCNHDSFIKMMVVIYAEGQWRQLQKPGSATRTFHGGSFAEVPFAGGDAWMSILAQKENANSLSSADVLGTANASLSLSTIK